MILLDTDHVTVLKYPESERCKRLSTRLAAVPSSQWGMTIITVEGQMRGCVDTIDRESKPRRQISAYRELAWLFELYATMPIILFNEAAAEKLDTLGGIHIGKFDKKIASIALATRSLLLTANTSDFKQVPGLTIDNWMD